VIVGAALLFSLAAGLAFAFAAEYFAYIKAVRPEEYQDWRDVARELAGFVRRVRFVSPPKR